MNEKRILTRRILTSLVAGAMLLVALMSTASEADRLVDRIVAVVDDQPIFETDIERLISLELVEQRSEESLGALRRRVLNGLIDHRLRLREVERYESGPVSTREIDRQLERIEEQFGGASGLDQRLDEVGLDREDLRYLFAQQYKVFVYIEDRLGPRILITVEDIQAYYDSELSEQMRSQGTVPPPFDEVRGQIRAVLREIRLNEEIEVWTSQLRQEADIVDFLDRDLARPPVVKRQVEEINRP